MQRTKKTLILMAAMALAFWLGGISIAADQSQGGADVQKQRAEAVQKARPEIAEQRKEAEQKAEKSLDKEAVAAIEETGKAIKAIADNKTDEALAA
ncbi:MAG TPA: hypothetical protein VK475_07380, partial [Pyrinomonadaceae bacterium]|nr:hypothetical protein [Pyrinomonadaceae bacterium]